MTPELRERWAQALEGGAYQQGQERLRRRERFCCLGVLCDIAGGGKWKETVDGNYFYVRGRSRDNQMLPMSVQKSVGLLPSTAGWLAGMNDEGRTFGEIAAYIRANL